MSRSRRPASSRPARKPSAQPPRKPAAGKATGAQPTKAKPEDPQPASAGPPAAGARSTTSARRATAARAWAAAQPAAGQSTPEVLGRVLLPLRAFLGFTFCFAGLQKLANPGFFTAGNPASIQSQLAGAVRRSPIHVLISPLTHVAVAVGLLIAFAELAIGVGTLLGLWQRLAAVGGIVLSLMLFLTVSFHSAPYYTGADIVFVFAWTPLLLAGAGSVLSLDAVIAGRATSYGGREASRREVMLKGTVTAAAAVGSLVIGGATAGLGRLAGGTSRTSAGALSTAAGSASASASSSGSSPGAQAGPVAGSGHPAGKAIGPATAVPVGQAGSFTDPATGNPSIVVHPQAGTFLAFDAVCPHAGCSVQYDPSAKVLVCPCHGSQFSASTGAVETGPAASGLAKLAIAEGQDGQLYVN